MSVEKGFLRTRFVNHFYDVHSYRVMLKENAECFYFLNIRDPVIKLNKNPQCSIIVIYLPIAFDRHIEIAIAVC